MPETTKINLEVDFLLFWLKLLEIGPTLLPTMSPQSATEILVTASQMNGDAAGSAARLLVDLLRHDRNFAGQIWGILIETGIESSEIIQHMAHEEHHHLTAAQRNIPVGRTYWE